MSIHQKKYMPYLMWFFPLFFFAYQFILRLWPGLMMPSIMEQFSIDASDFGLLAAFYYYGYAGMQIPVAALLDRFGARSILFVFALVCGLATLLFTYTNNFYVALFSRFLIGAGSAVGFLGVSKVVSEWFPKEQYARMIGFSFTLGLMGAIYGGKPVSLLIETYSWQTIALGLAILSIVIGCGALLAVRSPTRDEKDQPSEGSFKLTQFSTVLSSPVIWILALSNLLMVGSLEGFADVWGVPYLMKAYELTKGDAAGLVSFVFFGMLVGGPFLAFLSRKIGNYPIIALCGVGMACAFIFLLLSPAYNGWMLSTLFFCVGMMCCYQVIVFAAGSDLVSPQYLGLTIAFLNCVNMFGGSFFHTTIGRLMDIFWTGTQGQEGIKDYNLDVYQTALSIIPLCALIGTGLVVCVVIMVRRQKSTLKN